MKRVAALAAALLVLAAPAAAAAACPQASLPDIESEVMCPICGTTLELSDSPQASGERALIQQLIARCETKQQIENELVVQYGRDVLAEPPHSGFDLSAYWLPIVGLLAAAIGVGFALVRWRRSPRRGPPEGPPPSKEEAKRLDEDLARYEL